MTSPFAPVAMPRSPLRPRATLLGLMLLASLPATGADAQLPRPGRFVEAIAATDASDAPRRRAALRRLYAGVDASPLWTSDARPTPQATAMLAFLRDAAERGLEPRDYDHPGLARHAAALAGPPDSAALARFDVALSRSAIRFLDDLHRGRVSPNATGQHLPDSHRQLELAALARSASRDAAGVVAAAQPPYLAYRALERALARYRALAADTALRPPSPTRTALRPGDPYADAPALRRLLVALGDLDGRDAADEPAVADGYSPALAGGVAAFQRRHALRADSVLGPATTAALRVPLVRRVRQMELTLERWRWLPDTVPPRYAVVNIPGFRLYLFEHDSAAARPVLRMNVIVGQAGRRGTPVFTATMRELVLRPYWDVPPSIARGEIIPAIRRRPGYLAREALEIVRGGDDDAVVHAPTAANLARVAGGTLRIRQRPGPDNSLGLVKFVFPNSYNVYLHGTPAQRLFAAARRDFSHGCIRVEDPLALAAVVLRGQPGWDAASIAAATQGTKTVRVQIARPIAVYILYQTVVVGEDGVVHVYDDIYGHDARLARALAAARPSAAAAVRR